MKQHRVSLEVVATPFLTGWRLADLLGVPPSALTSQRVRRGTLWRYEPSTGQIGKLSDRIRELSSEVHLRRALWPGSGVRKAALAIDVLHDTAVCTVDLPLNRLVYGRNAIRTSIPEVSSVEIRCTPSDCDVPLADDGGQSPHYRDRSWEEDSKLHQEWESAGEPEVPRAPAPLVVDSGRGRHGYRATARSRLRDANEYIVSLDAFTSASATRTDVADVLGLPPGAFFVQPTDEGLSWTCEVEAGETVGLAERLGFLASQVHPSRSFDPGGEIDEIYLDIGVLYQVNEVETCSVSVPLGPLHTLIRERRLFVRYVRVSCYPCRGEGSEEG